MNEADTLLSKGPAILTACFARLEALGLEEEGSCGGYILDV